MTFSPDVLYEDNHLLVLSKPAGIVTMGAKPDRVTLLELAKDYIKHKYAKPGNVYLGVVSRLDGPTTGVVPFARTSKAAARLSEQFREGRVEKTYWAVVEGAVEQERGECVDFLAPDKRHRRMCVVGREFPGAKQARLSYRRLAVLPEGTLLEVRLETGRKHQIRLQFADRNLPVLGDRKYGAARPFEAGIALHARRLVIEHPTRKTPLEIVAPVPASWRRLGVRD